MVVASPYRIAAERPVDAVPCTVVAGVVRAGAEALAARGPARDDEADLSMCADDVYCFDPEYARRHAEGERVSILLLVGTIVCLLVPLAAGVALYDAIR